MIVFRENFAWTRDSYVNRIMDLVLAAFREYMCTIIAKEIGETYDWSKEVRTILKKVAGLIDPKTAIKFGKAKARENAIREALDNAYMVAYGEVREAKNKLQGRNYYPDKAWKIDALEFDGKGELIDMLVEFLPQYFKREQF